MPNGLPIAVAVAPIVIRGGAEQAQLRRLQEHFLPRRILQRGQAVLGKGEQGAQLVIVHTHVEVALHNAFCAGSLCQRHVRFAQDRLTNSDLFLAAEERSVLLRHQTAGQRYLTRILGQFKGQLHMRLLVRLNRRQGRQTAVHHFAI